MKRDGLFLLSVFCFFLFPAVAQEPVYTVTETELTELERISQSLAISRLDLQSQASGLAEQLRAQESKAKTLAASLQQAESKANTLNNQLQTERDTLKNLRVSYSAYEKEAARQMAEMQTVIDKQKDKIHRLTTTIIALLTVLVGFIIFAMIKLKRFFPFLP
ncbi:hypothetical protein E4N70_02175 [Treponema vincentii]|uniref:hypothetical protein n=1 Tax=Treponema vincentii TaxID=69710 RepID=UPI0020A5086C|nr:hypothetical protein [Treponema vincentii]UTC60411.1 hypothetical protein E4N70_02175 [Treponema vincentii]